MNRLFTRTLLASALGLAAWCGPVTAAEHGWITSVPAPVLQDNIFPVNIQRINGRQPIDAAQYRVDTGEITVRVSVVMNPTLTPKLRIANDEISTKEFKMTVESGTTYQIGGRIDPNASNEAQRDGSFWEPVIYKATRKD